MDRPKHEVPNQKYHCARVTNDVLLNRDALVTFARAAYVHLAILGHKRQFQAL
ncbi:hypothetical protein D3C76_1644300 [compost metagenome]